MEWQSIETAPKDGTRIIVGYIIGDTVSWACNAAWSKNEWYDGATSGFQPSHWIPMPKVK